MLPFQATTRCGAYTRSGTSAAHIHLMEGATLARPVPAAADHVCNIAQTSRLPFVQRDAGVKEVIENKTRRFAKADDGLRSVS